MRCFAIIVLLVVVCALIGMGVLFLGVYDVAATSPHSKPIVWAADILVDHSVERRAANLELGSLSEPSLLPEGAEHYKEMCEVCHGGPGVPETAIAEGLQPEPPHLAKEEMEWNDSEIFWIVKHGLKSAGMPAFGPTHSDDELKAITAFVKRLRAMSPEDYAAYARESGEESGEGHEHGAQSEGQGHH